MERRAVLKLVALAALSPRLNALETAAACSMHAESVAPATSDYKLQFFTEDENKLVDQLMEMIIPADEHSPGAHAARASVFADQIIATSEEVTKTKWRSGLALVREQAQGSTLADALIKSAENEENPKTELDHFFVLLKQTTVDGYYTSQIGIEKELEYTGNTYLARFPECTHPEHKG
jgi:hypothetical protein